MEKYELLKDVFVNIDELKKEIRLPKGGLYDSLLDLHKRLYNVEDQTVDKLINATGWGRRDVQFTKTLYNLAEKNLK